MNQRQSQTKRYQLTRIKGDGKSVFTDERDLLDEVVVGVKLRVDPDLDGVALVR